MRRLGALANASLSAERTRLPNLQQNKIHRHSAPKSLFQPFLTNEYVTPKEQKNNRLFQYNAIDKFFSGNFIYPFNDALTHHK